MDASGVSLCFWLPAQYILLVPLCQISGGPQVETCSPPPKSSRLPVYSPTFDPSMVLKSSPSLWGPYFHLPLEKIRHTSLKQSQMSSPKQLMGSTPWQHAYRRLTDEGWSLWARFDQPVIGRSWPWVYMECSQPHPFFIGATECRHQRGGAKELLWELTARLLCCKNRAKLLDMIAVSCSCFKDICWALCD